MTIYAPIFKTPGDKRIVPADRSLWVDSEEQAKQAGSVYFEAAILGITYTGEAFQADESTQGRFSEISKPGVFWPVFIPDAFTEWE